MTSLMVTPFSRWFRLRNKKQRVMKKSNVSVDSRSKEKEVDLVEQMKQKNNDKSDTKEKKTNSRSIIHFRIEVMSTLKKRICLCESCTGDFVCSKKESSNCFRSSQIFVIIELQMKDSNILPI